jgi:hypothetical protein
VIIKRFILLFSCLGAISCGNQQPRLKLFVPGGPIARRLVEHRPCPNDYKNCVDVVPFGYEELYSRAKEDLVPRNSSEHETSEQADLYLLDDAWVSEFRNSLKSFPLPDKHLAFQPAIESYWSDGQAYWDVPLLTNLQMIFEKGVVPKKGQSWADIVKMTSVPSEGSPRFVLRGHLPYALTNDFLPILWANGGKLLVSGDSASLEPQSEVLAAIRTFHRLAQQGPPYEELLSTGGLRLELEKTPAVIAIEWSAASQLLTVPDVNWSGIPCSDSPTARVTVSPEKVCQEAGVLSTWVLAAPKRVDDDPEKAEAVSLLFQGLTNPDSSGKICDLDSSLTSPPVITSCLQKPALNFYRDAIVPSRSGLLWRDSGADRMLLGRFRPPTPYWWGIGQLIGESLNSVLLDLQTEEQALEKLKTELSHLTPR